MANPLTQIIDLNGLTGTASGHIAGTTNAAYLQQAIVTVTDANNKPVASGTFQGSGEKNAPMPLTGGGYVLSFSGALLPLTLSVTCNYNSGSGFVPNDPNNVTITTLYDTNSIEGIQITGEDWVDNDFNDQILTGVFLGTPATPNK